MLPIGSYKGSDYFPHRYCPGEKKRIDIFKALPLQFSSYLSTKRGKTIHFEPNNYIKLYKKGFGLSIVTLKIMIIVKIIQNYREKCRIIL